MQQGLYKQSKKSDGENRTSCRPNRASTRYIDDQKRQKSLWNTIWVSNKLRCEIKGTWIGEVKSEFHPESGRRYGRSVAGSVPRGLGEPKNREDSGRKQGEGVLWYSPSTTTTAGNWLLLVDVSQGHPGDRSVQNRKRGALTIGQRREKARGERFPLNLIK